MSACFNRKWPEIFGYLGVFFGWMEETWGVYAQEKQTRRSVGTRLSAGSASQLELRDFGKVEVSDLHCRNYHVEGFFARGAHGNAHGFDI